MIFKNIVQHIFTILSVTLKKSMVITFILMCLIVFSCEDKDKTKLQKELLTTSMTALYQGNIDEFLSHADYSDFDIKNDHYRRMIVTTLLKQQVEKTQSTGKGVNRIEPTAAKIETDSILYVYYDIHFNDSTKQSLSQKIEFINGEWKLKMKE